MGSTSIANIWNGDGKLDMLRTGQDGRSYGSNTIATLYWRDGQGGFTKADGK
jgi:hypothetical protein